MATTRIFGMKRNSQYEVMGLLCKSRSSKVCYVLHELVISIRGIMLARRSEL